jgi:hypothetical protein
MLVAGGADIDEPGDPSIVDNECRRVAAVHGLDSTPPPALELGHLELIEVRGRQEISIGHLPARDVDFGDLARVGDFCVSDFHR